MILITFKIKGFICFSPEHYTVFLMFLIVTFPRCSLVDLQSDQLILKLHLGNKISHSELVFNPLKH